MPRTSNKKKSKNNNKTSSQAAKKNPTGKNDTAEEKKRIDELQMLHSSIDHFYEFNPSCQYDQEKLIDGLKWEKSQNDDDDAKKKPCRCRGSILYTTRRRRKQDTTVFGQECRTSGLTFRLSVSGT